MNETVKSVSGGVLAARCETAAVTRSPPHASSIGDPQTECDGEIPHQLRLRQTADLRDLEVERLERLRLVRTQERLDVVDALVEDHRQRRPLTHDEALLEGGARLLEEDTLETVQCTGGDHGVLQPPAAVGVGDHQVVGPCRLDDEPRPFGVLVGVGPELELEAMNSLAAAGLHVRDHFVRRRERHSEVQRELIRDAAPEQVTDRETDGAPERIPARDVDRALCVAVAHQGPVHSGVDLAQVRDRQPVDGGSELDKRCARSAAVGRKIGGPERADLAEARHPALRREPHDGARERLDHPAARHDVAAVDVRQVVSVDVDPSNPHRPVSDAASVWWGSRR